MTPADLDILIQQGEGTTLEFKEGLSSSFSRELVAMANTVGGKLLLGVRDDGTVTGVKDSQCPVRPHSGHRPQLRPPGEGTGGAGGCLRRENVPEYPMKALREAITNAVMHRDWFFAGANVFVEIYANRIEVISPGGLPTGLKLAELGRESIRRNPLIADLLHRIEFIEKAGTGIRRIRDEAREQGCPEPEFKIRGAFFVVVFRPDPEVRALEDQITGEVTPQDTPQDTPPRYPPSPRGSYPPRHRGSASFRDNIGRDEQKADPRSLGPEEYQTRPQNLPIARPASRLDRNDHPRQAAQQKAALSPNDSGTRLFAQIQRAG